MTRPWISRLVTILAACTVTTFFLMDNSKEALASWQAVSTGPTASYGEATTIPTANTPAVSVFGKAVTVSWAATDVAPGVPASGYTVARYDAVTSVLQTIGASCAGTIAALSCVENNVPDGSWKYALRALKGATWAGPESAKSATATVFPASAAVTAPATGQTYNAAGYNAACATGDICGTSTASSGATVSSVFVSIFRASTSRYWNGSGFSSVTEVTFAATGTTSWTRAFPATNFPADGSYTVKAYATDNASQSATATSTFTYDTTAPPTPTITGSPANPTNQTTATFTFTDTDPTATFECSINGGAYSTCTSPKSYSGLAAGTNDFAVRAVDAIGNISAAATYSWTIDLTAPPAPAITAQPTNPTNQTTATFNFTDGDATATFECSIDGGAYSACTGPKSYSGLAAGARTFAVRAVDPATNTSASTTYNWTIDLTAPAATDVQTTNGGGTAGRIDNGDEITFTFSEAMSANSIMTGWDGTSTSITMAVARGASFETLAFAGTRLGNVRIGDGYAKKDFSVDATMVMTGNTVVVTITQNSNGNTTVGNADNMVWTPGTGITDAAGNALPTTPRTETGTLDQDF